ncbi:MAG: AMP-binding protein [Lachnospiraceae bacterium]|nr:AMP-binding protein [Lachnospiraceae bacterium]
MDNFFWNNLAQFQDSVALMEESKEITYAQLDKMAREISSHMKERSLVFCICKNTIGAVAGYVGFLQKRIVPVMLSHTIDRTLYENLVNIYKPQFIWCPNDFADNLPLYEKENYKLIETGTQEPAMDEELAVMLTTSGSTGSPKFVRQTYINIQSNTEAIVEYLGIIPEDRAITTLPMNYTYGLSIVQSHLMAGARLVLTEKSFFDRGFWDFFKESQATTFGAVPYTYQMLDKLRFLQMDLPSLRYITQAGGRLGEELHYKFGLGMRQKGKALVVMYGATEATARMSYVPADKAVEKAGSIGIAIPGGHFELIDVDGSVIHEPDQVGELVYYGPNVTLGYAESREDLNKGDERKGRLETGDMAKRDKDGFYYVVGRKKRFLKIYGNRVNLVEVEDLFSKEGFETACVGEDDHMLIYTTSNESDKLVEFISSKTGLNRTAFSVKHIDEIPHNESGKVLYSQLPVN